MSKRSKIGEDEYISKEEILDDLREAFRELKLAKEGKIKLKSLREVLKSFSPVVLFVPNKNSPEATSVSLPDCSFMVSAYRRCLICCR